MSPQRIRLASDTNRSSMIVPRSSVFARRHRDELQTHVATPPTRIAARRNLRAGIDGGHGERQRHWAPLLPARTGDPCRTAHLNHQFRRRIGAMRGRWPPPR